MFNSAPFLCLMAGIFLAAAPIMGRIAGVNPTMLAILIATGTSLAFTPIGLFQNYLIGWIPITLGVLAGVVNGVGLWAFYQLVGGAQKGLWSMSTLPITFMIMTIGITLLSQIVFKDTITLQKGVGIALACAAIWFLR